ncbi:MAG: DUF1599 domain-containing protein [Chitinophagales bacterium]|nr:DUF1599 domain-containing protein [Chitinophagales bacterium]
MERNVQRTLKQYDAAFAKCRDVFVKKTRDYGTSWRMLRPKSITDQLYIKAKRIRTIDEKGTQKVDESIEAAFEACVNYGIMALIQLKINDSEPIELSEERVMELYDEQYQVVKDLMLAKNHDYGEAWREMRISSDTDMILTKLHRIKQIEDNMGKTLVSEGVEGHYQDIVNYSIFAMIKIGEEN